MAGTFRISGFTADAIRLMWVDETFGWSIEPPNTTTPMLSYFPTDMTPPFANYGILLVRLHEPYAQIYLDDSPEPTAFEDLPDDFGIDSITYNERPWIADGVNIVTAHFPVCNEPSTPVLGGGVSAYYWTMQPVWLQESKYNLGSDGAILTMVDPDLGAGFPPVFTKWNGFLHGLLQQGQLEMHFARTPVPHSSGYQLFTFVQTFNSVNDEGYIDAGEFWGIHGTYDSYPPPPNPTVYGAGAIDFGGAPTIQILSDASGIYTLTPGLYRDELWQRSGTTATTVEFMIPQPFFKTGYIGDN